MFKGPYWEAAKMAFMIAGGAGVAFAAVKGVTMIAGKGFHDFITGMFGTGTEPASTTEVKPEDTTGTSSGIPTG